MQLYRVDYQDAQVSTQLLGTVTGAYPKDEYLAQFWPYMSAMLLNLGSLKVERVQSMLGIFALDYKGNAESLTRFLNEKVLQGELIRSAAGAYSIPQPPKPSE